MTELASTAASPVGSVDAIGSLLAEHRRGLVAHCYRMLGSVHEAEDAVQETAARAWAGIDRFEGRSGLLGWVYGIATHVCLDMLRSTKRRALPMDLVEPSPGTAQLGVARSGELWVEPIPDALAIRADGDPAEVAVARENIRLAFVVALQLLPPRQRAVLILRDVLRWPAADVAELLGTTVVSANSALQRARSTLASRAATVATAAPPHNPEQQALLDRYVDAFERFDIDRLVSLLHEDATLSMPPFDLWLRGRTSIAQWFEGMAGDCRDSQLVPIEANGASAFAAYRPGPDGGFDAFGIQLLELSGLRIVGLHAFLDVEQFAHFGLPLHR